MIRVCAVIIFVSVIVVCKPQNCGISRFALGFTSGPRKSLKPFQPSVGPRSDQLIQLRPKYKLIKSDFYQSVNLKVDETQRF